MERVRKAWAEYRRPPGGVFDFTVAPRMVEYISRHLERSNYVTVLGGGTGLLAQLLLARNPQRTVRNTDLVPIKSPLVPTTSLDIESFNRSDVFPREARTPCGLVLPFSFEYVRQGIAAQNITRALLPGEVCVLASHMKQSSIVNQFGRRSLALAEYGKRIMNIPTMESTQARREFFTLQTRFLSEFGATEGLPIQLPEYDALTLSKVDLFGRKISEDIKYAIAVAFVAVGQFLQGNDAEAYMRIIRATCDDLIKTQPLYEILTRQAMEHPSDVFRFFSRDAFSVEAARFANAEDPNFAMVIAITKR